MKSYLKIFVPFALAIVIGSLSFVFAQNRENANPKNARPPQNGADFPPPPPGRGEPGFGLHPALLDRLNLTDAQKERIQAIHFNSREVSKEYFDKVRAADEQLRKLTETGSFDEEQARAILTTKAAAITEMEIIRLRTDAAILNLLTAEQKTTLTELRAKRPEFPSGGDFPRRPNGR